VGRIARHDRQGNWRSRPSPATLRDGQRVLDVGCGNGITAIELARRFAVRLTGVDYAEELLTAARDLAHGQPLRGTLHFRGG